MVPPAPQSRLGRRRSAVRVTHGELFSRLHMMRALLAGSCSVQQLVACNQFIVRTTVLGPLRILPPPPPVRTPTQSIPPGVCSVECLPFIKPCPGSSSFFVPGDPLRTPAIECSGHGVCEREGDCRVGDSCAAVCTCDTGYLGSACALTEADMQSARALRGQLVDALVRLVCVAFC